MQHRSVYARTSGDMLVGGYDGPGINPSDQPPIVWWYGNDSGGGEYPIGPNGPWSSGSAAALPAVTRATALVCDPIATSPLKVQELGFAGKPLGTPRWLTDPMLTRPDGRFLGEVYPAALKLGRSQFWGDFLRSALWFGTGAFICTEDETGQPLAGTMRLVHPQMLSTERDAGGALCWTLGGSSTEDRAVFDRSGYLSLGPVTYRIVVLRNPHSPVDAEGRSMGVFEQNPAAFRLAGQVETYTSGQFKSGVPAGYLSVQTPGLQQEDADDLRAKWMQHHGGDRRSVAVLSSTVQFTPINLSPVDAALGEVKRLNVADVGFAFAIDPNMLGAGLQNSASYSNVRDYFRQHQQLGIGLWVSAFQDCLSALLPGTQGVKVDFDAFTRAEPKERYDAYAVALDAGILTIDEVRALEGLPPLPEPAPEPQQDEPPVVDDQTAPEPEAQRHLRLQPWRG